MLEFQRLLDLIENKPDPDLTIDNAVCPYCACPTYAKHGTTTTLTGGNNHEWHERSCKRCTAPYVVERKGTNVWVTVDKGVVRAGMPSCFEAYTLTCKCGGAVIREYMDLAGLQKVESLGHKYKKGGGYEKLYRTFWECSKCSWRIETDQDYYRPEVKHIVYPQEKVERAVGGRQPVQPWVPTYWETIKVNNSNNEDFKFTP